MNLTPKNISVIIPTYNDCDNLDQCLTALIKARGEFPVTILVVDDASNDATAEIVMKHKVEYLLNRHNNGQSYGRNLGAERSDSSYILFLDSDVVVGEDYFQKAFEFIHMDKPEGLVALHGVFSLNHPCKKWSSLFYNTIQHIHTSTPCYSYAVNTSCFLIKRQEFMDIGKFNEEMRFLEDEEFGQRMAALCKYALHGPVEFVHLKQVTMTYLLWQFILGGKIHSRMTVDQPVGAMKVDNETVKVGQNRMIQKWLVAVLMGVFAFLILNFVKDIYWKTSLIMISSLIGLYLMKETLILFKVKSNPLFFIVGTFVFIISPWLIIYGLFVGKFEQLKGNDS
ncbi:MAG: glycosyltransferase [Proteobacteria bacterium]|nr:glycosyltransferase [Pseudomonadota bacterium]